MHQPAVSLPLRSIVNVRSFSGITALHQAVAVGAFEAAEVLVNTYTADMLVLTRWGVGGWGDSKPGGVGWCWVLAHE